MSLALQTDENENRFHAIKKIQKAMKHKYNYEGNQSDLYLLAGLVNSIIYVGDNIKELNDNMKSAYEEEKI